MFRLRVFLLIVVFPGILFAKTIDINLFAGREIKTITITPVDGNISFSGDDLSRVLLSEGEILYVNLFADSVKVRNKDQFIGKFKTLEISSTSENAAIRIKPIFPDLSPRTYEGSINIIAGKHSIQLINTIDFEKYIAAVVESEGGTNAEIEYYKSQAVLCRTYAVRHFFKHKDEGYNLCDRVHCQAYKGRPLQDKIINATFLTKELIIVDTMEAPINAAFHSNSGGETANSEDVWLQSLPYLRSVDDPYSLKKNHSKWTFSIEIKDWIDYLESKGFDMKNVKKSNLKFKQTHRKSHYFVNGRSIPLRIIRSDFKLKSTYFNILIEKGQVKFIGKGYGHGVGLSQEGAIQMAEEGKSFEQIIDFYYKDVKITNSYSFENDRRFQK